MTRLQVDSGNVLRQALETAGDGVHGRIHGAGRAAGSHAQKASVPAAVGNGARRLLFSTCKEKKCCCTQDAAAPAPDYRASQGK